MQVGKVAQPTPWRQSPGRLWQANGKPTGWIGGVHSRAFEHAWASRHGPHGKGGSHDRRRKSVMDITLGVAARTQSYFPDFDDGMCCRSESREGREDGQAPVWIREPTCGRSHCRQAAAQEQRAWGTTTHYKGCIAAGAWGTTTPLRGVHSGRGGSISAGFAGRRLDSYVRHGGM